MFGIVKLVIFAQPENALLPIEVKDAPIAKLPKLEQPEKALSGISVKEEGTATEVRFVQFSKAPYPRLPPSKVTERKEDGK